MLDDEFVWECPNCQTKNWEFEASSEKDYECRKCDKKYLLEFNVDVTGITEYKG